MKKKLIALLLTLLTITIPFSYATAEEQFDEQPASSVSTTAVRLTPNLIIQSFSPAKAIPAGSSFTLSFTLQNTSRDFTLKNIVVKLSGGEVFTVGSSTDTVYADSVAPLGQITLSKNFVCQKNAESGTYPITASTTFEYIDNGEKLQGTSEVSMTFCVNKKEEKTTKKSAALTPQLIVSGFSYGGKNIEGGESFNLSFTVKNTSKDKDIKNVIVKLSGGEAFIVAEGTDTVNVESIKKNSSKTLSKRFTCLSAAPSGVYPVSASITYEYFENDEKAQGTSDLTMSVPVVQPDKISIENISLQNNSPTVGQETDCAFKIINSGKTLLSNCTITLSDENGKVITSSFIGNIEAGTQFESNYNLAATFDEPEEKHLCLTLEYENEGSQKKKVEQKFTTTVIEEFDPFQDDTVNSDDAAENNLSLVPIIIGAAAAVLLAVIIIIVVSKKRKKRKAQKECEDLDEEI